MGYLRDGSGEPLTPIGRVFLQKEMVQVVYIAMGMKHNIDVEAVKVAVKDSVMVKHPRFCSLMVRDAQGVEQWRRTDIDIDRHFIIVDDPVGLTLNPGSGDDHDEAAVNEYLADMSLPSSEFDESKPLWEIHVLKAHRCMVLRIHHALGDGTSLMSMLLALCKRVDGTNPFPTIASSSSQKPRESSKRSPWYQPGAKLVHKVWLSVVFIIGFLLRALWVRDTKNPISGGDGVELWPRKLATARFQLDDMKLAKRAIPGATINDVLIGVISAGLSRYLDWKRTGSMRSGMQMTGLSMVNLRKPSGLQELTKLMTKDPSIRWGNRFGIMLIPLCYNHGTETSPLDYITKAKEVLERKKSSFEAAFSSWIGDLLTSWFGAKAMSYFLKRIICNTTFMISNMVGPQEQIEYLGNPITYIRANISSMPHSLTMHMVSYAERADLQILVAKDIIPDPEFLAKCFEGALVDMKEAVATKLAVATNFGFDLENN